MMDYEKTNDRLNKKYTNVDTTVCTLVRTGASGFSRAGLTLSCATCVSSAAEITSTARAKDSARDARPDVRPVQRRLLPVRDVISDPRVHGRL